MIIINYLFIRSLKQKIQLITTVCFKSQMTHVDYLQQKPEYILNLFHVIVQQLFYEPTAI